MSRSLKQWRICLVMFGLLTVCGLTLLLIFTEKPADASYLTENTSVPFSVYCCDSDGSLLSIEDGNTLLLNSGCQVEISYQSNIYTTYTNQETPLSLLRRLNLTISPLEMVALTQAGTQYRLEIASELVFYETVTTAAQHETIVNQRSDKPDWYESTLTQGVDGSTTSLYEMVYQDGQLVSRHLVEERSVAPVTAITEVGTIPNFANYTDVPVDIQTEEDGSGTLTLENGQIVTFHSVMTMNGTAYTAHVGGVGTVTYSGTTVREGIVAVDKKTIPLGSKLYVVDSYGNSYGFCIAEDTGVIGNSIDIYMDTYQEARQFGRRTCTVYILD